MQQNSAAFYQIFRNEEGVLDEILSMIGTYNKKPELNNPIRLALLDIVNMIKKRQNDHNWKFYTLRKLCLELSHILNKVSSANTLDYQGMSDVLYFYSVTFSYFTNHNFPSVSSQEKVVVRKCDIPNFAKYFSDGKKQYILSF